MAWVQTESGDYVNLHHVIGLTAVESSADLENDTIPVTWEVDATTAVEDIALRGSWPTEEAAQGWIVRILTQGGEKVVDGIHGG